MIPVLFSTTETVFTHNGLGRLVDCLSCKVTEERNGIYECEFQYPINGRLFSTLIQGGIIGVIHDDTGDVQPFDIYKHSATIDGVVTFNARHISYRLGGIPVTQFSANTCAAALTAVGTNSAQTNPFTFSTDKTVSKSYNSGGLKSARAVLMGEEGSILEAFQGEYKFDKWTVSLLAARGSDTGVTVRYGKNMTGITWERDESNCFNAVAPCWTDGTNTVTLPEVCVQPATLNLINAATNLPYYWLDSNGIPQPGEDPQCSDFIRVTPGAKYTWSFINKRSSGNARCYCYNASKSKVSRLVNQAVGAIGSTFTTTMTIPSNAVYIRLSYGIDDEKAMLNAGNSAQPYVPYQPIVCVPLDMSQMIETQPTEAQLRTAATNYLNNNEPWKPYDSITVDFVALWQTPEYENVAAIQRISLCDTVSVYWTDMGIVAEKAKVVRAVYDVLAERYDSMEIGSVQTEFVAITSDIQSDSGGGSSSPISIDSVWPVGSIYMSVNNTDPGTLFGGTWSRIQDTFLLAAGTTYTAGSTGGEATHTLTTDEMPQHSHQLTAFHYIVDGGNSINVGTGNWKQETFSSWNAGNNQAHNNMPPYLAVYVWKRTA